MLLRQPPSAASEQDVDGASPAILAKVTPPHISSTHSAEQLGAAGSGDRAPLSLNAAAPAPQPGSSRIKTLMKRRRR